MEGFSESEWQFLLQLVTQKWRKRIGAITTTIPTTVATTIATVDKNVGRNRIPYVSSSSFELDE
jgi:hypothetical protein